MFLDTFERAKSCAAAEAMQRSGKHLARAYLDRHQLDEAREVAAAVLSERATRGCIAKHRLDEVLTGADGTVPEALGGLREAFLAAEQPRSIFVWLDRSPGAALLRRLVTGEVQLSHDALDDLPQTPSLRHLRQLLVATGALPERDPHLAVL